LVFRDLLVLVFTRIANLLVFTSKALIRRALIRRALIRKALIKKALIRKASNIAKRYSNLVLVNK
jgi:hypothetical protein